MNSNDITWGKKLRDFRLNAKCNTQGELAERLSKAIGVDISANEISRYENNQRIPKDRSRHRELIMGLVKLESILTVEEANGWLALGQQGYLTKDEIKEIFPSFLEIEDSMPKEQIQGQLRGRRLRQLKVERVLLESASRKIEEWEIEDESPSTESKKRDETDVSSKPSNFKRKQLERRRNALEESLDTYNLRIEGLKEDIARTMDNRQRLAVKEKELRELEQEYQKVSSELTEVEQQLGGVL